MREATFTFRVDEALKAEFSTATKVRDRSGAQLLRASCADLCASSRKPAAHESWFHHQVHIGLNSANAGNLISAAEVEAKFAARRAATRRQRETAE